MKKQRYRVPARIIHAIAMYYACRERRRLGGAKWDKVASLAAIDKAATSCGWGLEACVGTFWLSKPGRRTVRISPRNFPTGEFEPRFRSSVASAAGETNG